MRRLPPQARALDRRAALQTGAAVVAAGVLSRSLPTLGREHRGGRGMLRGVNLAGAEFGSTMPGQYGKDYTWPDEAAFHRFHALGFDCIRLPFRWERLQPDLGQPLDGAEWSRLSGCIAAAARAGQTLILDLHNYARRKVRADGFRTEHMIGSRLVPAEALASLWSDLASRTRAHGHVVLGIMNEPADMRPEVWLPIADATIRAIRKARSEHLILAPGIDWSGAHSWYTSGNTLMERLVDPARNMAIEVHQYLDADSSGRSGGAVSPTIGAERLEAFQEWARARRLTAFLGELGGGSNATALAALEDMLIEVEANRDVWLGWTAWAAGPWWPPDEPFRLEPDDRGAWPRQTRVLASFTRPATEPSGRIPGTAIDLDLARARFHGVPGDRLDLVIGVDRVGPALARRRDGLLDAFAPDAPRLTDLGLTIEGAARNAIAAGQRFAAAAAPATDPGPDRKIGAWRLATGETATWSRAPDARDGPAATHVTFGLHLRADPLQRGTLSIELGSSRAEVDLARWTARMVTDGGWASLTGSGEWRRFALTLPPPPDGALPRVTLHDGTGVLIGCPMLEALPAPTAYAQLAREADAVQLRGDAVHMMRADTFTLMLETRALTPVPVGLPFLADGVALLLGRRSDGAVVCPPLTGAHTRPIALDRWLPRRRMVLAVSRPEGRVVLATQGEAPRTFRGRWPMPTGDNLRLGGLDGSAATLNGIVSRIALLPTALSAEAAVALTG